MQDTDALAISQKLANLDKPSLNQAATALATTNAQQANKIQQFEDWMNRNVAKHIGRGGRLGITVVAGAAVGAAYGTFSGPWPLVGAAAAAAASGAVALMAEKPDVIDGALAFTAGAAAGAVAIETAKGTSDFLAKREQQKGQTPSKAA